MSGDPPGDRLLPIDPPAAGVRPIRADEASALREIRLRALRTDPDAFGSTIGREHARPPAFWLEWAEQGAEGRTQRTFVTGPLGGPLGALAMVRPVADGRGHAELLAMWVAPELRRRGVAAALCDAAAAWAARRSLTTLELQVVASNDAAHRAYERAGFTVTGRTTWTEHGRTLDELVMRRPIGGAPGGDAETSPPRKA